MDEFSEGLLIHLQAMRFIVTVILIPLCVLVSPAAGKDPRVVYLNRFCD